MIGNNVLGIVYSNTYDENLSELTAIRTMGSVPFAARYRLIDFVLSGMVESGISKVGIITNSNYRSLMDHLGSGMPWDLSRKREGMTILPPFNQNQLAAAAHMTSGGRLASLSGIMGYISRSNKEYVLLSDCNVVTNPDYAKFIRSHIDSGADISIACKYGKQPKLANTMVLERNGDRITDIAVSPVTDKDVCFSINTIIMSRALLERLVNGAASTSGISFEAILQKHVSSLNIRAYDVESFAEPIDSLLSYYKISMDLINGAYSKLFLRERLIYTKVRDYMPAIYGINSDVKNSLVADGCIIKGKVENCILFRGVRVDEDAVVKNSIIMQDSYISAGAKVNCAILDKGVAVKPGRELSGAETYPLYIGKSIVV